jgi:hypothetical protein
MQAEGLLRRPLERGAVDPHAMQNHGELARDRDLENGATKTKTSPLER